jgi:hypothetical protein
MALERVRSLLRGTWVVGLVAVCGVFAPLGCADSGTGGGGGADCVEIGADGCFDQACFSEPAEPVSFAADVLPIFEQSCSLSAACHGNPTSPNGPSGYQPYLGEVNPEMTPSDVALIFSTNVDQPSVGSPNLKIVDPGKPESSYLMKKMDGDLGCGSLQCAGGDCKDVMPQGSGVLPRETRDVVRGWILAGAENN